MKNVNNIKRGPLANCIALHDFANVPDSLRDFIHYIFDFFRKNGIEPTRMASQKTDKTVSVKIGTKQWEAVDYKGAKDMVIHATPPNHGGDMFDSIFTMSLDLEIFFTLVLCFDDQILGFNPEIIERTAKDLSSFFGAQYGYAYQRKFSQGPTFYPYGVHGGNERDSDEDRKKITKWNHEYRMSDGNYKTGDLRDLYPYNFLSKAHLDRTVLGMPLKAWIEADPSRGTLTKLTDTLWSWHVDPCHIDAVRDALTPTGLLICL